MTGDEIAEKNAATERKVVRQCECGQSFKTVPDGPDRCPWCKVVIDGGDGDE